MRKLGGASWGVAVAITLGVVIVVAAASASMGAPSHDQRLPTRPIKAFPLNAGVAAAHLTHTAVLQRSGVAGGPGRVGADTGAGQGWLLPVVALACLAGVSACLAIGIAVGRGRRNSLPGGAGRRDADSSPLRPRPPFRHSWRHSEWFPTGAGAALMPLVGYVSPNAQRGDNRKQDLRTQMDTIAGECERRGLALLETVRERGPQRARPRRTGLGRALQRVLDGEAQGVAVAELARLGDSVSELGRVLEWFLRSDVRLVAASPSLDTQDQAGWLAVHTIVELSRWEHERLAERTRVGMRAAQRKGPPSVGDQPELRERIARMRAAGMTLQGIADRLNAEGVPTVRGGAEWRTSSVQTAAGYRRRSSRTRRADDTRPATM